MLDDTKQEFHLCQCSHFAMHIHGGMMALVFDDGKSDPVTWSLPLHSDHFVILIPM